MKTFLMVILIIPLYANKISNTFAYNLQKMNKAIIVDIRTKEEFINKHPKDAINIPAHDVVNGNRIFRKEFITELKQIVTTSKKSVIMICRTGTRTHVLSTLLEKYNIHVNCVNHGFESISYDDDWVDSGLPIEGNFKNKVRNTHKY